MDRVLPQLKILFESEAKENQEINSIDSYNNNNSDKINKELKNAINLLKTICVWIEITSRISHKYSATEMFKFVPIVRIFKN